MTKHMPVPPDWSKNFTTFVTDWKQKSDNGEFLSDEYLGDEPFDKFVLTEQAESWDHFLQWLHETARFLVLSWAT